MTDKEKILKRVRNDVYYTLKPLIPRIVQLCIRRKHILMQAAKCNDVWPIDEKAGGCPAGWKGWPENKRFALVLTHDVDKARGHDRCRELMRLEEGLGLRSSFNFVPKRYAVSEELRDALVGNGFEVGVHGLYHDGKYYRSKRLFQQRALEINRYLREWNAVGYRAPSMLHKLDWFHDLDIEYDSSTFDTDPFEPNSEGICSIFPLIVHGAESHRKYIEIPYTLPQDFTLFIAMRETKLDIWKRKLEWIVEKGGMALLLTHPDYMNFGGGKLGSEEYPARYYEEILEYIKSNYEGQFWHVLPRDMARYWAGQYSCGTTKP